MKSATIPLFAFALGVATVVPAFADVDPAADIAPANVAAGDVAAGANVVFGRAHLMAARTLAGAVARALRQLDDSPLPDLQPRGNPTSASFYFAPAQLICLGNVAGGAGSSGCEVLKSAYQHPIYVNTASSAIAANFGNPAQFLTDYSASNFSHLTDQYIYRAASNGNPGVGPNNRYPLNKAFALTYKPKTTLTLNDVYAIVHAGAVSEKITKSTGIEHMFHVFIPKGQDTCYSASACYSPDKPGTFAFCGYHSAVQFSDVGLVLFTVEPFQGVKGCEIPLGYAANYPNEPTASNDLTFSAASVLAHEVTETITDPLLKTGWRAEYTPLEAGQEIGDICTGEWIATDMNGHTWITQEMYSNWYFACANGT